MFQFVPFLMSPLRKKKFTPKLGQNTWASLSPASATSTLLRHQTTPICTGAKFARCVQTTPPQFGVLSHPSFSRTVQRVLLAKVILGYVVHLVVCIDYFIFYSVPQLPFSSGSRFLWLYPVFVGKKMPDHVGGPHCTYSVQYIYAP